jgi:FMN phosphatase YigB (HAD superfamily)
MEIVRMKTWIFDVDSTLTPPRSKIDDDFEEFFYEWILDNDTYFVQEATSTN